VGYLTALMDRGDSVSTLRTAPANSGCLVGWVVSVLSKRNSFDSLMTPSQLALDRAAHAALREGDNGVTTFEVPVEPGVRPSRASLRKDEMVGSDEGARPDPAPAC